MIEDIIVYFVFGFFFLIMGAMAWAGHQAIARQHELICEMHKRHEKQRSWRGLGE